MASTSKNELNPQISFTEDWQAKVQGVLRPGGRFTVRYDASRLPEERSTSNGIPTWNIFAFASFSGAPSVQETLKTPGGPTVMAQEFEIPADARDITMWFMNTGRSGREFWDSHYGQNYCFRFPQLDLELVSSSVVSSPATSSSGFQLQVLAAKEVSAITVSYSAQVPGGDEPVTGSTSLNISLDDPTGRALWSVAGVEVPPQAPVRFFFYYSVGERTFVSDNEGKGFVAAPPLTVVDGMAARPIASARAR
jgi:hypothetical protein